MDNKAVVINAPGDIRVTSFPMREPGDGELLVRTRYVALCGSDIKLFRGTYSAPHKYPIIIGHEWVGEVVKTGGGISSGIMAGDIVTGDCSLYCNTCDYCSRDSRNHCTIVEKKGISQDGACAQYIIVDQQHVYGCPPLHTSKPLALVEPLAVSVEAVVNRIPKADLKKIRNALVIGAGGIGAMAVFMLLEEGIPGITVVDVIEDKLAVIDSFGFEKVKTLCTDLSDDIVSSGTGFDLIIEAAGSGAGIEKAIELSNPCGKIVCVGHQNRVEIDFSKVMKKSLTIISSIGSTGGFERAIKIMEKYFDHAEKLITRVVPLSEVEHFFAGDLGDRKDIKILVDLH